MTNNIHIYIAEPLDKQPYELSVQETQDLTNGTCDSIIFQEMNYIDYEDISSLLSLIYVKLSYNGIFFLHFNHLESIIGDYNHNKISEKKLNDLIFSGRRNLVTETYAVSQITNTGFIIKKIIYDDYIVKMELVKNGVVE